MIARTVLWVLLSLAALGWGTAKLAPTISADHGLSFRVGLMLVIAGGLLSVLRLFAGRRLEARSARAAPFWGYFAPPWTQDLLGVLLIFAGAGLLAWGMS